VVNLGAPEGSSVPGSLATLAVLLKLSMLFFAMQSYD